MRLLDGGPPAGPWRVIRAADVRLRRVVALGGRGAAGRSTTTAARSAATAPGAAVVRTDDVARHHAFSDRADGLAEGVLEPVRAGRSVRSRPPARDERGRPGAITVPAGCPLLRVGGAGVGRRAAAPLPDAVVRVRSDHVLARARGIERDAEERPPLATDRSCERAVLTGAGTPVPPHGPYELVVAP